MTNLVCKIFKEQFDLIKNLPQQERKEVLYLAIEYAFNQFENQNENQNENAYISNSLSNLSISILNILNKTISVKEFSSNYGGNRKNSGRKSNENKEINQVDHQVDKQDDYQVVDKDKDKDKDKIKNNKYGECKNVLLTEEQYKNLSELDNFDLALEKLDTWLGTSGSKNRNKNHYAYFKSNSWVWKDLKPKQTETEETVFIDEHTRIDEQMPEFNDMTYDECYRAFEWLQEKMYCQSLSKSKFVEIVRKFKGIK